MGKSTPDAKYQFSLAAGIKLKIKEMFGCHLLELAHTPCKLYALQEFSGWADQLAWEPRHVNKLLNTLEPQTRLDPYWPRHQNCGHAEEKTNPPTPRKTARDRPPENSSPKAAPPALLTKQIHWSFGPGS